MFRLSILTTLFSIFASFPASSHYSLQSYSIGSGGTNSASSAHYAAQGNVGENVGGTSSSAHFSNKSGSVQAEQANVPPAPALSTGSNSYYNQLGLIINNGANPSDATFAVAISSNNFATTYYVQVDGSLGATPYFQTYTGWGGATGSYIVGLTPSTSYEVKVSAFDGKFTQSAYGPYALASTVAQSLTFSLTPTSQNIGSLLAGSVVTSPAAVNFSIATNAAYGAGIYVSGQYGGLHSSYGSNTIPSYSGNLTTPSHGFGIQDVSASSPIVSVSPYNGSGTTVGSESSSVYAVLFSSSQPITSGTASSQFEAKSSISDPASSDYTEILTFVAAASF